MSFLCRFKPLTERRTSRNYRRNQGDGTSLGAKLHHPPGRRPLLTLRNPSWNQRSGRRRYTETDMTRFKSLPLWPAFIVCSAILYFCCFYRYREPFWSYACGVDDISLCSDPVFVNGLRQQVLEYLGLIGTPALIALLLARKSLIFLSVWTGLFVMWTSYVYSFTYGIDGQNGCEACDFGMVFMGLVSWASPAPAIIVFVFHSAHSET
jgi:hypothetical protein